MSQYWSKLVNSLTPYTPGEQPKIDGLIKLNTNENPYGPSPAVISAIHKAADESLRKYPDPNAEALKTTIANYHGLKASQVFVGNSSDEVLAHVFRGLLKQDKALLFPDLTYSFYPVYCQLFEIEYQTVPLRQDFTIAVEDYGDNCGGIIFANPNAPTGIALSVEEVASLLESHRDCVVVVDEAYVDFAECSSVGLIDKYPNLLVVQTLSKSRSLAGLRVGFALGQAHLIEALERIKNSFHPYTLDTLALAAAQASFDDENYFESTRRRVIETRQRLTEALLRLNFEVLPSSANFVLCSHPDKAAKTLFTQLRERKIITRYFDKERIRNHLRISVGNDEDTNVLIEALTELVT